MKNLWLPVGLLVGVSTLLGKGGAWQTGIPATGNASSSKNDRHIDVAIENETLKIDLHRETVFPASKALRATASGAVD